MQIGVDFDNTIICYDQVFHKVALEQGLIPQDFEKSKRSVRDYLRKQGKEDAWTEMQGYVYGSRLEDARQFPGVVGFFKFCRNKGIPVFIISHKTRYPYLGRKCDLHAAAYNWMKSNNYFDNEEIGLSRESVFFELTRADKIQRISELGCSHFIDDLPEFLSELSSPGGDRRILFDPNENYLSGHPFRRVTSWWEILELFNTIEPSNN
jgi:hypothetical protein